LRKQRGLCVVYASERTALAKPRDGEAPMFSSLWRVGDEPCRTRRAAVGAARIRSDHFPVPLFRRSAAGVSARFRPA